MPRNDNDGDYYGPQLRNGEAAIISGGGKTRRDEETSLYESAAVKEISTGFRERDVPPPNTFASTPSAARSTGAMPPLWKAEEAAARKRLRRVGVYVCLGSESGPVAEGAHACPPFSGLRLHASNREDETAVTPIGRAKPESGVEAGRATTRAW